MLNSVLAQSRNFFVSFGISRIHRILSKSAEICSLNQTDYLQFLCECRARNPITLLLSFLRPSNLPPSSVSAISSWPELTEHLIADARIRDFQFAGCPAMIDFVSQTKLFSPPASLLGFLEGDSSANTDSIQIPDDLMSIEPDAFSGSSSLQHVLIGPNSRLQCIGARAFQRSGLQSIMIPESVTMIEEMAFAGCSVLEKVEFAPRSILARICKGAFQETAVCEICFPAALEEISAKVFLRCSSLELISFGPHSRLYSIGKKAFEFTMAAALLIPQSVVILESKSFAHGTALSRVDFAENASVERIEMAAFQDCLLESVVIPTSIRHIGDRAFSQCGALKAVEFAHPSHVEKLGREAFAGCAIAEISIPPLLLVLEFGVFADCPLATVGIDPDSRLRRIATRAFANCAISQIFIPPECAVIQQNAFCGCLSLATISFSSDIALSSAWMSGTKDCPIQAVNMFGRTTAIPPHFCELTAEKGASIVHLTEIRFANAPLLTIGPSAFSGQDRLTELSFPASVITIESRAFYCCSSLELLHFPLDSQLISIGSEAFANCKLQLLEIPQRLEYIREFSFSNCSSLKQIVIGYDAKLHTIERSAFARCNFTQLTIPEHLSALAADAFVDCPLTELIFSSNDSFSLDLQRSVCKFPITTVWFCHFVTRIAARFFLDWKSLTSVFFRDAPVLEISANAFGGCMIESLDLPTSVTAIRRGAFASCRVLRTLTMSASSELRVIEAHAFSGCPLTKLDLPPLLEAVDSLAFQGCECLSALIFNSDLTAHFNCTAAFVGLSIASVHFLDGVRTVGERAFEGWESLREITFSEAAVAVIGTAAFSAVPITELHFSRALKRVGVSAFSQCHSLHTVVFDLEGVLDQIEDFAFAVCAIKNTALPVTVSSVADTAFAECPLTSITFASPVLRPSVTQAFASVQIVGLRDTVTDIDGLALSDFPQLTHIAIAKASRLRSIGPGGCSILPRLGVVFLPASVTKIDDRAFFECTSLSSVRFQDECHLQVIGAEAFRGCRLGPPGQFDLFQPLESIGDYAFAENPIERIRIPASVQVIGRGVFLKCTRLFSVEIEPKSRLESLGEGVLMGTAPTVEWVFSDCPVLKVISSGVFSQCGLEKIQIPSQVHTLGDYTFDGCKGLAAVEIPVESLLVHIGENCFRGCIHLTRFVVTERVENIAESAFSGCITLRTVAFRSTPGLCGTVTNAFRGEKEMTVIFERSVMEISARAFQSFSFQQIMFFDGLKTIGKQAFASASFPPKCSLTFPSSLIAVHEEAFAGSLRLTTLKFTSNTSLSIDSRAFSATSLTNINFPDAITAIDQAAFRACTALPTITITKNIVRMRNEVFAECMALSRVNFDGDCKIEVIPYRAFFGTSIEKLFIPTSIREIETEAFADCKKFVSIRFSNAGELIQIREKAFAGCGFNQLELPSHITEMDVGAFEFCKMLRVVKFHPTSPILSFGPCAFKGCEALETIILPRALTTIQDREFRNLTRLVTIDIATPSALQVIGRSALKRCGLSSFAVPRTVTTIKAKAFTRCIGLTDCSIPRDSALAFIGDCAFTATSITSMRLPPTLTDIGASAFAECKALKSVIFAPSIQITSLECRIFEASSICAIIIPISVVTIGRAAFAECRKLTSVTFRDESRLQRICQHAFLHCSFVMFSLPELVIEIEEGAFMQCAELKNLKIESSQLINIGPGAFIGCGCGIVTIPRTVRTLSSDAFRECVMLSCVLFNSPCSLQSIGARAFHKCIKLQRITIPISVAVIGEDAFNECCGLTQIVVPRGGALTEIEDRAFAFSGVKFVEINTQITRLGSRVFYKCAFLSDLRLADVQNIGPESFAECPLSIIHLPKALAGPEATNGHTTHGEFLATSPALTEAFPGTGNLSRKVDIRWV